MSGVLESVNQRTQLVGQNRLELLLFKLQHQQIYGINVFKVKEVLQCPKLTQLPHRHPVVRGVAHIRGETIPIMDMSMATGQKPVPDQNIGSSFVIITEYNRKTQGFLVSGVERIVNLNWEEMHPPPKGVGRDNYLTAVARMDERMIEVIDVEKILAEVAPSHDAVSEDLITAELREKASEHRVLIVDDSSVARRQIVHTMESLGLSVTTKNDGKQAYDYLQSLVADGSDISEHISLMISDVEMPEMDGYTLTSKCKNHPNIGGLYIMLHTSLSGVFNKAMVEKVGANNFMAKFNPDELAQRVNDVLTMVDAK